MGAGLLVVTSKNSQRLRSKHIQWVVYFTQRQHPLPVHCVATASTHHDRQVENRSEWKQETGGGTSSCRLFGRLDLNENLSTLYTLVSSSSSVCIDGSAVVKCSPSYDLAEY